jgi:hypothetical protein
MQAIRLAAAAAPQLMYIKVRVNPATPCISVKRREETGSRLRRDLPAHGEGGPQLIRHLMHGGVWDARRQADHHQDRLCPIGHITVGQHLATGVGCPLTPVLLWDVSPPNSLAQGLDLRAAHCC